MENVAKGNAVCPFASSASSLSVKDFKSIDLTNPSLGDDPNSDDEPLSDIEI